jgi:hypothetical protein
MVGACRVKQCYREGVSYPSVHLHSVVNSTIHWTSESITSLHVTACRHTQLDLTTTTTTTGCCGTKVQQVRWHDCSHMHMRVHRRGVTGGMILEQCTQMQFIILIGNDPNDNHEATTTTTTDMPIAIHDFCWLRRDAPSPNFTVEYQQQQQQRPIQSRTSAPINVPATPPATQDLHNIDNNNNNNNNSALQQQAPVMAVTNDGSNGASSDTSDDDDDEL